MGLAWGGFVQDVGELLGLDLVQVFVAPFELLEGFDDGLGHASVGFVRAADEDKFFAAGDAFVPIGGVETDAEKSGGAWLGVFLAHEMSASAEGSAGGSGSRATSSTA